MPGDTILFQLTLFNNSLIDATGVTLEDYVPNGFRVIEEELDANAILINGSVVKWSDIDINALSLYRVSVKVIVRTPGGEVNDYRNVAQITRVDQQDVDSSPGNDDGDQSEDDEDFAIALPMTTDLSLSKDVSDKKPNIRDVITYSITVTNEGNEVASHVEITDYIPVEYCINFTNISNHGILLDDRILWTDLYINPGESLRLTFDATVATQSLGKTVVNRAEVSAADQSDPDSEPGNMEHIPVEDDEASVSFSVGKTADLELIKEVDRVEVAANEMVTFTITVINYGPDEGTDIAIEDELPNGYTDIGNISHDGKLVNNNIIWAVDELGVNESVVLSFEARVVHGSNSGVDYKNVAQITASSSVDPDSQTNNDDGDQSEDDEDFEEVIVISGEGICVEIETAVFLEGPFQYDQLQMTTKLNRLGYLPGQKPSTFFGTYTEKGQPFSQHPWNYYGSEGEDFVQNGPVTGENASYPSTVTDWVLVSLRTGTESSSTVCMTAALLHKDGTIEFVDGFDCCELDPDAFYYLVIEHRNHLLVMSHIPVPVVNGKISYDFRYHNSYTTLVGAGQKEMSPGVYAMYAGNGDQQTRAVDDTDINTADLNRWISDDGLNSSYFLRDFDLNGDVNVQDKGLLLRNNGIFSDVPRNNN